MERVRLIEEERENERQEEREGKEEEKREVTREQDTDNEDTEDEDTEYEETKYYDPDSDSDDPCIFPCIFCETIAKSDTDPFEGGPARKPECNVCIPRCDTCNYRFFHYKECKTNCLY